MFPNLLFQLGPLSVYSFGVILAAIFVLGVFLFWRAATREGFASDPIFDLIFLSTFVALAGGRLSFIIATNPSSLAKDPLSLFRVGEGIFWAPAFLFGLVASYLYTRRKKEWSFFKLADLVAPVLALGQGVGFLGAEATDFLSSTIGLWPIGVGFLALFVFLELGKRKISASGVIFCLYLLASGFLIAVSEYLREMKTVAFEIDLNYLLGAGLVVGGVLGLFWQGGLLAFIRGGVVRQPRFKLKRRRTGQ